MFITATFASGLVYAGLLAYLSSSSFVYIDMLGVPVEYFGFIFLSSVAGYMLGSGLSARLSRHYDSEQTVLVGAALAAAATGAMWLGTHLLPRSIAVLLLPMMFYSTGMGLVLPNAMAVALRPFAHIAGTASALLGFIQMSLSALATALLGTYLKDTPVPMLNFMLLITLSALLLSASLYRSRPLTKSPTRP